MGSQEWFLGQQHHLEMLKMQILVLYPDLLNWKPGW